jgi:hypothetical protein
MRRGRRVVGTLSVLLWSFLDREQDRAQQVKAPVRCGFVVHSGHDGAAHLADEFGEFVLTERTAGQAVLRHQPHRHPGLRCGPRPARGTAADRRERGHAPDDPEVEPLHRRYQILQNQRGLLLAAALRARTDVVVCVVPYRLSL